MELENIMKNEGITWLFTGDSITHGCLHTNGERNFFEHLNEYIRWTKGRKKDYFLNTGVSGYTTEDLKEEVYDRIERFKPNIVVLMVGMNDASSVVHPNITLDVFEENLKFLISKIRDCGALTILQTSNDIWEDSSRTELEQYMKIIRKVAKDQNITLVDNYRLWKDNKEVSDKWLNDAIHPNGQGHKEITKNIIKTLSL